jgi:hypothetical protein
MRVDQRPVGLVAGGGGFARVVVAHRHQHAAMGEVPAMLTWRNTSPVRSTPGPLPYQRPKTPSNFPSPRSSACWLPQSAVAARSSFSPGWNTISEASRCFRPRHLHVDCAQRRSAIAGDKAGRVQPGRPVPRLLHQHQAHQRLSAVHQNRGFPEVEPVVERDRLNTHLTPPCRLGFALVSHYRSKMLT